MEFHGSAPHHLEARGQGGDGTPAGSSARLLELRVGSGGALDVREFVVRERMSALFEIKIQARSEDANIDFDDVVGRPASFSMQSAAWGHAPFRSWTGICSNIEQVRAEERGLSGYELTLVPNLWLLTQRRNHRMFQQLSELDIAKKILAEWGIEPRLQITGVHKTRKYRVQYGESDYAFVCRMLEDAGISFYFEQASPETELVLSDAPHANERRDPPLAFRDEPTTAQREHVTKVKIGQRVRPGRYTLRDHDTRLPASLRLLASATSSNGDDQLESKLERFHYTPGAFLYGSDQGEGTPHADDRGKTRTDVDEGAALASKRLHAKRSTAKTITFETNAFDLAPGVVMSIVDHPRAELSEGKLLVVESTQSGKRDGERRHVCEARRAHLHFRPALSTPKPKVSGVECATVVGPSGEEIHTDEFGRVRVHFHWDRESEMDHKSSCWIPVSQAWGGAGYGGSNLPRIGQEVLVDFLGGDPDRPVIIGRVYTKQQATPYTLPANKTQSGWKSNSTQKTGGFNEIMFEDAAGRELVNMQAEKDLHKLVKNDEEVTIGHDRSKLVKNDDHLTVDNDRTKLVKNDEDVTIGHDRSKLVKNDDALTVGNDRTKLVQASEREVVGMSRTRTVGVNESVSIGAQNSINIGADQSIDIGGSHSTSVASDHSTSVGGSQSISVASTQSTSVGGAQTMTVGLASAETVGLVKALTVGGAYEVTVGGMMNTNVMMMQTESVGMNKTVTVGVNHTVTVGKQLEMVCGKAKVTMDAAGKITWEIDGGAKIVLDDKNIFIIAGGGGTVTLIGGPVVDINP